MTRPNILLIQSDQHRWDCLGINGHPFLKTPHLDALAAQGVNFTHAFCPIPLCTPARNCLLHGVWPTRHRVIANEDTEAGFPEGTDRLPVFSKLLKDAGYYLGYVAKWHVHPTRLPADYGFSTYDPEKDYLAWRVARGLPPRKLTNSWFGQTDTDARPDDSRLAWGAGRSIAFLEAAAKRDAPFFLRWDPSEPHLPNVVPEPYASMYPLDSIQPWPGFADKFRHKAFIQPQQLRSWKVDRWTWDDWRPIVQRYLGEITLLDHEIGRLLAALDRLGLRENTLVIYTSDHGDMCGSHGMMDKHFIMYDDVMRVPLIVRWPRVAWKGATCDAFVVNALDLAATFCAAVGLPVPSEFQGESLEPLLRGEAKQTREDVFGMYHGNQFGLYSQRMVRDRRWKYVWNATAEDELYDLGSDPGELRNLAMEPSSREELSRLRHRLVRWMESTRDTLLNPWTRVQLLEGLKP